MLDILILGVWLLSISLFSWWLIRFVQTQNQYSLLKKRKPRKAGNRLHSNSVNKLPSNEAILARKELQKAKIARVKWAAESAKLQQQLVRLTALVWLFSISTLVLSLSFLLYQQKTHEILLLKKQANIEFRNKQANRLEDIFILNTPESPSEITEDSIISQIGSKDLPQPLGQAAIFSTSFPDTKTMNFFTSNLEVTILNTARGAAAWQVLVAENQFNPPAPAGKEYMLNRVRLKVLARNEEAHLRAKLSDSDFSYLSANGKTYSRSVLIVPNPLPIEIPANTIIEGNLYCLVEQRDTPTIRFQDKNFFSTQ